MADFEQVNLRWVYIAPTFMVSVVYVPILVHFSLEIPPSLEEQFLQCLAITADHLNDKLPTFLSIKLRDPPIA